jgi:hypothetical protein
VYVRFWALDWMGMVWDYDLLFLFSVHGYVSFAVYIVNSDLISGGIYEMLEHCREVDDANVTIWMSLKLGITLISKSKCQNINVRDVLSPVVSLFRRTFPRSHVIPPCMTRHSASSYVDSLLPLISVPFSLPYTYTS